MQFSLYKSCELPKNSEGYGLAYKFKFSQSDVSGFAAITGDNNPIHVDESYAKETIFGKPIIHGFFVGSIFSRIFGMEYPGMGTIYLSQSMKFLSPVFVDEFYMANITVKEVNLQKNRAIILTEIFNSTMSKVLTGEAVIKNLIYK
jgi:acyl dehydratase